MTKTKEQEEKSLEVVPKYAPAAPIGSIRTLKDLIDLNRGSITALLPKHVTVDRLARTLLTAFNRQPKLLKCTQASLLESINRASELGLDLSGTLGDAWLIPFTVKVGDEYQEQAVMIPGYRGLARLARQSGEVAKIEANVVRENDHFEIEFGTEARLVFRPCLKGPRGKTTGCYAYIRLKDGQELADYMDVEDVEKVRRKSKQPDSLMWREHWDEGARKTVFRRLSKWAPLSPEKAGQFHKAVEQANLEFDLEAVTPQRVVGLPSALPEEAAQQLGEGAEVTKIAEVAS